MGRGYECWDLKQFDRNGFIDALQAAIPPVNENVHANYRSEEAQSGLGVAEDLFNQSTWGLLIPVAPGDGGMLGFGEALFLINLFSPVSLHPLYSGSDFGIQPSPKSSRLILSADQNQAGAFKCPEFVTYFDLLLQQGQYGAWSRHRVEAWDKEDWRLFAAALLHHGLQEYDGGKSVFGWQRESADMAAVLESLFTAGDGTVEGIGYRLRKRIAVLLSGRFQGIEESVKSLYNQRSDFVHGRFFEQMAKESARHDHDLPIPDMISLRAMRERVRWAFLGYLYLARLVRENPAEYNEKSKVLDVLEDAIIDTELRARVLHNVGRVYDLLPAPQFQ